MNSSLRKRSRASSNSGEDVEVKVGITVPVVSDENLIP